uniref:Uncharacterized protein n=1 Tax=Glossina brevipalpis TaxID=37001 RepID=A0A1A9W7U2_9MUSC
MRSNDAFKSAVTVYISLILWGPIISAAALSCSSCKRYGHLNLYGRQNRKEPPYDTMSSKSNLKPDIVNLLSNPDEWDAMNSLRIRSRRTLSLPPTSSNAAGLHYFTATSRLRDQPSSSVKQNFSADIEKKVTHVSTTFHEARKATNTQEDTEDINHSRIRKRRLAVEIYDGEISQDNVKRRQLMNDSCGPANKLSRNSLNRHQFNSSIYGSTSALSNRRLLDCSSPFYKGKTTYGGEAAYQNDCSSLVAPAVPIAPSLVLLDSSLSNLSSPNNSLSANGHVGDNLTTSSTTKHIFHLNNDSRTPLDEANKMPNTALNTKKPSFVFRAPTTHNSSGLFFSGSEATNTVKPAFDFGVTAAQQPAFNFSTSSQAALKIPFKFNAVSSPSSKRQANRKRRLPERRMRQRKEKKNY